MISEFAVYRDDRYPSAWIDERAGYPERIASFLKSRGFNVLNAESLRSFMTEAIEKGQAHNKLVVFSQDIVPDTVIEGYSSNTTFREYLDAGGNVLWIGDIPLFYVGKRGKQIDLAYEKGYT